MAQPARFDLTGRTALITGASSGLGERFARLCASAGAKTVLAARRKDRLEVIAAELKAAGHQALAVEMDVTDEASVRTAFDAAETAFGTVSTVVANAGTNIEGPAVDLPVEDFGRVLDINVTGVFLTAREGARRLIASGSADRRDGRIVLISSVTAQAVSPGLAAYSASKAAVLQMGRVLARDWATKGVNVNVLCPGYIETDLNADWFATDGGRKQIGKWPRRRLMDAHALDAALLTLAGDDGAFMTGTVLTVDDGQTL